MTFSASLDSTQTPVTAFLFPTCKASKCLQAAKVRFSLRRQNQPWLRAAAKESIRTNSDDYCFRKTGSQPTKQWAGLGNFLEMGACMQNNRSKHLGRQEGNKIQTLKSVHPGHSQTPGGYRAAALLGSSGPQQFEGHPPWKTGDWGATADTGLVIGADEKGSSEGVLKALVICEHSELMLSASPSTSGTVRKKAKSSREEHRTALKCNSRTQAGITKHVFFLVENKGSLNYLVGSKSSFQKCTDCNLTGFSMRKYRLSIHVLRYTSFPCQFPKFLILSFCDTVGNFFFFLQRCSASQVFLEDIYVQPVCLPIIPMTVV